MGGEKKLYNSSRRDTPKRSAHDTHPYASIPPTRFVAQVDDLLGKESFDEKYERELKAKAKKDAAAKKKTSPERATSPAQPKDDEHYGTETEVEAEDDLLVTDDAGSPEAKIFEEEAQESRKQPPNSERSKRRKTDANSISSTDSSKSAAAAQVSIMRDRKERERVQAADERSQTGGSSHRQLAAYKLEVQKLTKANQEKDRSLKNLSSNFDNLNHKYEAIAGEHSQIKGFFKAARDNPKLLEGIRATNNPKKRKAELEDSTYEESSSDDTDVDDDVQEVQYLDKEMVSEGQRAVKLVWRTIKFIGNNKQDDAFKEAVMDNYGKEELVYYPGENDGGKPKNEYRQTDEFKAKCAKLMFSTGQSDKERRKVEKFRKNFKATYGGGWVSYLNNHRSYANVSELWSVLLISARTPDLSPIFSDLRIYSKGPKMEFLSSWRRHDGPRCLLLTSS